MLQLFQSNRIEALVTLVASQIKNDPQPNPLLPETILVQSPGMSQWLKLQLAQQNSIAANINFPLPSSFIWQLYQKLIPDVPKQSPFNKDRLAWRIYECLGHLQDDECFQPLKDYMDASESTSHKPSRPALKALRRFKLAEKVADVFDNYLMYRSHWLDYWLQGNDDIPDEKVEATDQVAWQAKLWRQCHALIVKADADSPQGQYSRAQLHLLAIEALGNLSEEQVKAMLPNRMFIFGVTSINQQQLEFFEALAKRIDVQMFRLNPCQEYWGDLLSEKVIARITQSEKEQTENQINYYVTGNPLLASWGKVGKDNNELINQIEPSTSDLFLPLNNVTSVLSMIQNDIFELSYRGQQAPLSPTQLNSDFGKRIIPEKDESLSFNCCHSVTRELEVLKDQLLTWFDKGQVEPQDVLVMVPDINVYAPYIDSIFGADNEGAGTIPYSVADRSDLSQHSVLQAFLSLFQIPQSRFAATELLGLLEIPQVAYHFDVNNDDLRLIKRWLVSCHIKWGVDKQHKANWSLPEFEINTWHAGLRSLLVGLSDNHSKVWQGTYANPEVEGLQSIVLGKLLDFLSYLVALSNVMAEDCTLTQWQRRGLQLYADLFDDFEQDPLHAYVSHRITSVLSDLALYETSGDFSGPMNNQVVHHLLKQFLSSSGVNQSFIAGKVNFCTLMPMRSVPFDAICVLGLNETDYPRQVDPISFDLVATFTPRKGDRSRKLDDRYLFLEALCSARKYFYTSYLAFSVKDNTAMMPSLLLSELMDYVDDSFLGIESENKASSELKRIHKLQPFDPAYYDKWNDKLTSYNRKWFGVIDTSNHTGSPEASTDNNTVTSEKRTDDVTKANNVNEYDLEQLVRFWSHPIKYFYQTQLETRLEIYGDELTDTEVFQHDGLQKYKEIDALLNNQIFHSTNEQDNHSVLSGAYPFGQWGEDIFDQYKSTTQQICNHLQRTGGGNESWQVRQFIGRIELDSIQLVGNVELLNEQQVTLRAGKSRFVDKLVTWIRHLFLSCHQDTHSIVASLDTKWQRFEPVSKSKALSILNILTAPFVASQQGKAFYWHPSMALAIADFDYENQALSSLHGELTKLLQPSSFGVSLYDDDYARRHQDDLIEVDQERVVFTKEMVTQLLEYMSEAQPEKLVADNYKEAL